MRLVGIALILAGCVAEGPRSPDQPAEADGPGAPAPLRLLTRAEYRNTIRDLLGPHFEDSTSRFPAENDALGLDNIATSHQASQSHVDAYREAAASLSAAAVERGLGSCEGEGCGASFLRSFGRRAFRRPPTDAELTRFEALYSRVEGLAGPSAATEAVVQAILQSPQFLYRVEFAGVADGERVRLDGYVRASRLSYLLWASMPDDALLDAAAAGALDTADGLEAEARRMFRDPKARAGAENFYRQWLETQAFETMSRDAEAYPGFQPALALELRRSLHAFVDHAIFEGGADALFGSSEVWTTPELAALLDLPAPEGNFGPVTAPERRGLVTQPALMAALGKPDGSAPILRGVWVLERLLCRSFPPPPPDAPVVAPDPDPNATTRERFAQHTEDPACQGCHQFIDPVGFAFEHYDGIGRWRALERGRPVDASGAVTLAEDTKLLGPVEDAVDLAGRLASAREVRDCVARQWFRYGLGRAETRGDEAAIRRMGEALHETGEFEAMLAAFVRSDAFGTRAAEDVR